MKSEDFTGTVGQMKTKSNWLASEDFLGLSDIVLTIAAIKRHTDVAMDAGRKEPELFAVHFEKSDKGLILNATNRKVLSSAFGAKTKDWVGKKVCIYVQSGVRKPGGKAGETCNGLRLKAIDPIANPLLGGGQS